MLTKEEYEKTYQGIGFSQLTSPDFTEKLLYNFEFEDILNQVLAIHNYTQDFSEVVFTYMAVNPQIGVERKDKIRYSRKEKALELFVNLDRERLEKATQQEALQMMCELYLESIEKYLTKRKDFDAKRYYQDVKEVFVKHEFIKA